MPRPRKQKIISAFIVDRVNAYPRATPINGAVQGVATRVANTPLRKEPPNPLRESRFAPRRPRELPISKTPKRLSPIINIMVDNIIINVGDCS